MLCKRYFFFVFIVCLILSGSSEAAKKVKRELRFPRGSSLVVAVALASFLPKGLTDGFAHVLEFDLGFPFPERLAIGGGSATKKWFRVPWKIKHRWTGTPYLKHRGRRTLKKEQESISFVKKISNFLTELGLNAEGCMSRLQCEVQQISSGSCLLEELIFTFFGKFKFAEEECKKFDNICPISLITILSHSEETLC